MKPSWSLAVGLVGCAPLPAGSPTPAPLVEPKVEKEAEPAPLVELTVVEDPEHDRWQLNYRLREPADALRFLANRNRFRAERWEPQDGARWVTDGDYEELHVDPAAREFTVEFATMADPLQKDYELNLEYSDGSRLLYTGHVMAVPLDAAGQFRDPQAVVSGYRFRFRTGEGRDIRVAGAHGRPELAWDLPWEDGRGTYVYFGNIEPLAGDGFTAIVDPGMPAWLVDGTKSFVPQLFAFYASEVGTALPFKPLLLLSWGGEDRPGRSAGGGGVPGALQLSASGRGFIEENQPARVHWRHFVAHEVFHLWNGQTFHTAERSEEEWLVEGSAEYFAERALLDSSTIDAATLARRAVERANICLTELDGAPLLGHDPPLFGAYYPCGWALMAAADQAAQRADRSLGDVMAFAFSRAESNGAYETEDFITGVEEVSGDAETAADIRRILHEGIAINADEGFAALLGGVQLAEPAQGTLDPYHFAKLLSEQLVRCDCEHSQRAQLSPDEVIVSGHDSCNVFAEGGAVTHVAGFRAMAEAPKAYQALLRRAARGRKTSLTLKPSRKVALRCRDGATPKSFRRLLRLDPSSRVGSGGRELRP